MGIIAKSYGWLVFTVRKFNTHCVRAYQLSKFRSVGRGVKLCEGEPSLIAPSLLAMMCLSAATAAFRASTAYSDRRSCDVRSRVNIHGGDHDIAPYHSYEVAHEEPWRRWRSANRQRRVDCRQRHNPCGSDCGHGAVVALPVVVTRDVPPMAIVAGVPPR